jgi:hypothetical protein
MKNAPTKNSRDRSFPFLTSSVPDNNRIPSHFAEPS